MGQKKARDMRLGLARQARHWDIDIGTAWFILRTRLVHVADGAIAGGEATDLSRLAHGKCENYDSPPSFYVATKAISIYVPGTHFRPHCGLGLSVFSSRILGHYELTRTKFYDSTRVFVLHLRYFWGLYPCT